MITKSELKAKDYNAGHYFFSKETMKFFNSRLETGGYYGWQDYEYSEGGTWGWFFVYSNMRPYTNGREYKVAFMREDGTVSTNERPTFDNLREAKKEAQRLAKESTK